MVITRKLLISFAAAVVALFVIADPLGDSHHGLGKHNAFAAHLGEGVWAAFLIGAVAFIVLVLAGLVQRAVRSLHSAR